MIRSCDRAVGIPIGYGLAGQSVGVRVPVEARFFSFPRHPGWLSAHPASYSMNIPPLILDEQHKSGNVEGRGKIADDDVVLIDYLVGER